MGDLLFIMVVIWREDLNLKPRRASGWMETGEDLNAGFGLVTVAASGSVMAPQAIFLDLFLDF